MSIMFKMSPIWRKEDSAGCSANDAGPPCWRLSWFGKKTWDSFWGYMLWLDGSLDSEEKAGTMFNASSGWRNLSLIRSVGCTFCSWIG